MKPLWAYTCLGRGALGHSVTPSPASWSLGVTTTPCLTLLLTQIYSPDLPSRSLSCFSMILLAHAINSLRPVCRSMAVFSKSWFTLCLFPNMQAENTFLLLWGQFEITWLSSGQIRFWPDLAKIRFWPVQPSGPLDPCGGEPRATYWLAGSGTSYQVGRWGEIYDIPPEIRASLSFLQVLP